MIISYNWLSEYLPEKIEPERLSHILTSVGLEVEKMESFEQVKGSLQGLVIGEVLHTEQHPNADKLKLTKVNIGNGEPLQIVCGAPNVATGQKVIVATVGTTIYPNGGEPITMKVAKIRGIESYGMICAEDEIGLGVSHAGIMVMPVEIPIGTKASNYFKPYSDIIYEIGLTPNRMDAMSHWGVARDVCAYLSHHDRKEVKPKLPSVQFNVDSNALDISVTIENKEACKRYAGICVSGVKVGPSPKWLQERLTSIGLRPINNIVDITNFIQHETGQPLHAFDYDVIEGHQVIIKTLPGDSTFVTLDEKERKITSTDLMICDRSQPLCIAGVFGGLHSGVTDKTDNIFLESAWFEPVFIRRTSFRHGLRTDAATRFEKGIDISNVVTILKRAAVMIKETTGGKIASEVVDIFPNPPAKKEIELNYSYLKKLSGKYYHPDLVKRILVSLGFSIAGEGVDSITLQVPFHKPDITIPADIVEEVLRIDGLDNIDIPTRITMTPSNKENDKGDWQKEKISNVLTGLGFSEILTNSITNSDYLAEKDLKGVVQLLNNLSNELNIMRPSMLPTALEVVVFNINRKNSHLKFFEFGKTYATTGLAQYNESNHLCLYLTGQLSNHHRKTKNVSVDFFYTKGIVEALLNNFGLSQCLFNETVSEDLLPSIEGTINQKKIVQFGKVHASRLTMFDIKQPVFFADFYWDAILQETGKPVKFSGIPKYPAVERDLALVVPQSMKYSMIRDQILQINLIQLKEINLFDIFESEKLGPGKKSMAINLTFLDEAKTLTDKEIDGWMNKIMVILGKELGAEIRK